MNEANFNASIRHSIEFFTRAALDEVTVNLSRLKVNTDFNEVALAPDVDYESIYRCALSLNHFNVQLKDYALFQFSWDSQTSWRLAYYPNPWISGVASALSKLSELKEMLEAGAINSEEFMELLSTDFQWHQAIPMFRYEYSESQYVPVTHPAGHFHIGTFGQDRWAWSRKLSPKSFSMLVVRMYYPEVWLENSSFHTEDVAKCWEIELRESLTNDGASTEFSVDEAISIHLNAIN
ncbi:DUF2290 domain-containing protein [Pseudooceanicola aestuarii]|uniref:DUF2290 domain-containing protein n=1 Tax=Pseudooceanicola aestuarii TaxID=2697319 RepID=UPI0013D8887D|nr:DUF2290 domain-containing protein [Pseudooceanicola aestuarii]